MSAHTINKRGHDHFEPEAASDPYEQRRIKAHLEQIDYAAYAANKVRVAEDLRDLGIKTFERLAIQTASARMRWLRYALALSAEPKLDLVPEKAEELARRRVAFEELAAAYEGLRRLIERGYAH